MLAIFVASSQSTLPALPFQPSDMTLHAAAYAVMSALIIWAATQGLWRLTTARVLLAAALVCTAYGFTDEVHQRFVPNRHYDLADLAADAVGAFAAGGAIWAWSIISRGRDRHHGV